jgi:drug/metabolite transporter (DMT)-like permease
MKWTLIALIIFCTVASDVLQSFEMKRSGAAGELRRSAAAISRPLFILSVVLLAISFFAFLEVLKVAAVSFVSSVTSSTYVFDGILAKFLLKEHVNGKRWLGIGFICSGVILVALG